MTDATIKSHGYLLDQDIPLFRLLELAAWRHATWQKLPLKVFEPKRRPTYDFGLCYPAEGRVVVAVRWKRANGLWNPTPIPAETLIETLAHELAHLRNFPGEPAHGPKWRRLFRDIHDWMLDEDEYLEEKLAPLRVNLLQ